MSAFPQPHYLIYFNPRSAQGGATLSIKSYYLRINISIHAPRKAERRDQMLLIA